VHYYGDKILRTVVRLVNFELDENLPLLIKSMKIALHQYNGDGIAAPQIGCSLSLIAINRNDQRDSVDVLINPKIVFMSNNVESACEQCLSLPGISADIMRSSVVTICAYNEFGHQYVLEKVEGLLARVIQHEIDHLNGILIIDRMTYANRQMISSKLKVLLKSTKLRMKEK